MSPALSAAVSIIPYRVKPKIMTRPNPDTDKRIIAAPPYNTDLPWDLLTDCTLDELLIYYPEHVFQWPGLTILYNHYNLRVAAPRYDYAPTTRFFHEARGLTDKRTLEKDRNRLRQWVKMSGAELLGRSYDPSSTAHYTALYQHGVGAGGYANVSDYLQSVLKTIPGRAPGGKLLPALPLAEVGKSVKHHPQGNFAARVQAALLRKPYALPNPQLAALPHHPMISFLHDNTSTFDDRFNEHAFIRNHNALHPTPLSNPEFCLLPPEGKFLPTSYHHVRDENGQPDRTTQNFGWIENETLNITVFNYLEQNFTQEQVIREYWRDLDGEVILWVLLKYPVKQLAQELPREAFVREYGRTFDATVMKKMHAGLRKRTELAIMRRLRESRDDSGWNRERSKNTLKDNKAIYNVERAKYDAMRRAYDGRLPSVPIRQPAYQVPLKRNDDSSTLDPERQMKRQRLNSSLIAPLSDSFNFSMLQLGDYLFQQEDDAGTGKSIIFDQEKVYASSNGFHYSVPRIPNPNGTTPPEWWREERRRLFTEARMDNFIEIVNKSFNKGWDAIPIKEDRRIEYLAANWSRLTNDGSLQNYPFSPYGAIGSKSENIGKVELPKPFTAPTQHQLPESGLYHLPWDPYTGLPVQDAHSRDDLNFHDPFEQSYHSPANESLRFTGSHINDDLVDPALMHPMYEGESMFHTGLTPPLGSRYHIQDTIFTPLGAGSFHSGIPRSPHSSSRSYEPMSSFSQDVNFDLPALNMNPTPHNWEQSDTAGDYDSMNSRISHMASEVFQEQPAQDTASTSWSGLCQPSQLASPTKSLSSLFNDGQMEQSQKKSWTVENSDLFSRSMPHISSVHSNDSLWNQLEVGGDFFDEALADQQGFLGSKNHLGA